MVVTVTARVAAVIRGAGRGAIAARCRCGCGLGLLLLVHRSNRMWWRRQRWMRCMWMVLVMLLVLVLLVRQRIRGVEGANGRQCRAGGGCTRTESGVWHDAGRHCDRSLGSDRCVEDVHRTRNGVIVATAFDEFVQRHDAVLIGVHFLCGRWEVGT